MKKYLFLLAAFTLANCSSDDFHEAVTFPRYGNYCGYDRPAANETPETLDDVDTACKRHDECYTQRGKFNTVCDTTLIADLKTIKPDNEPERAARKAIISYFRNSPQKELMEINLDKLD